MVLLLQAQVEILTYAQVAAYNLSHIVIARDHFFGVISFDSFDCVQQSTKTIEFV